ncbi:MAG: hypothetical protein AB7O97_04540 [Planctomycetota bacterium]
MKGPLKAALLCALALVGCTSTGAGGTSQSVVEATAQNHPDCTRLTLHCMQADGTAKVCASTLTARIGTASDPEDLQAMRSGQLVVLEEGEALDVTVPLVQTDGRWTTVCGVTLERRGQARDAVVARARAVADEVKAALGGRCDDGACCRK